MGSAWAPDYILFRDSLLRSPGDVMYDCSTRNERGTSEAGTAGRHALPRDANLWGYLEERDDNSSGEAAH